MNGGENMSYNFKEVEKKWQEKWEKEGTFEAKQDFKNPKKWGILCSETCAEKNRN